MPNRATIKRAASYGVRLLQSMHEDMGSYPGRGAYSRQMHNDIELAIAMLKAAPDLFDAMPSMLGYFEAGFEPEEPVLRNAIRRGRAAYDRGLDRSQAEWLSMEKRP